MTSSKSGQLGFTLIETVLALSITAVLLVVVFSALRLGISSWERSESVLERASLKRNVVYRLEREAASAYPFLMKSDENKLAFFGSEKAVGFLTVASTPSSIPGPRWVYFVSGEEGLKVYEKPLTADDFPSFEGGALAETEPEVREIRFEYMGPDGQSSFWEPGKDKFPRALKAQILLRNEDMLTITVPVGAGYWQSALSRGKE
ncbi:hypothetical protein BAC1_01578 [uncultured bacterium]|nr:hypothetical protein BAC1_01578 [uncultured bacterium]